MADATDPIVHLSALTAALQEASEAIEAISLGIEQERAAKASSDALSAPYEPPGGHGPGA